ncbi:MAG: hypothetical protein AAFR65_11195 [Pseudomonadota bacterium]
MTQDTTGPAFPCEGGAENGLYDEEFEASGFTCKIIVHTTLGHLCGYVRLPADHPMWGKDYDDVTADVHGGLTYARDHAPLDESDGGWWLGFDCAHYGDLVPSVVEQAGLPPRDHETLRDNRFVRCELKRLAQQLAATHPQNKD